MAPTLEQQVSLRTAYLIMFRFALAYRDRAAGEPSLADLLGDIAPVGQEGSADPEQMSDWLRAAEYVQYRGDLAWDALTREQVESAA